MTDLWLPERIREHVAGKAYEQNEVGMSGSKVFMFDDMVLKIQRADSETENEVQVCRWLDGRIPTPRVVEYLVEGDTAYSLMTRVRGKMLCDPFYMNHPDVLLDTMVQAFRMLWAVDIGDCPCDSSLDVKLARAAYLVEHGLVDMELTEPETFGENGFSSPRALLQWLEANRPGEEPVLSHGDFCLPNLFAEAGRVTGFIDLGRMGTADRWQDLALAYRSLKHNFEGVYSGGKRYEGFPPKLLFERLGIEADRDKLNYYILLDELF